jgi:hypothetical protein
MMRVGIVLAVLAGLAACSPPAKPPLSPRDQAEAAVKTKFGPKAYVHDAVEHRDQNGVAVCGYMSGVRATDDMFVYADGSLTADRSSQEMRELVGRRCPEFVVRPGIVAPR